MRVEPEVPVTQGDRDGLEQEADSTSGVAVETAPASCTTPHVASADPQDGSLPAAAVPVRAPSQPDDERARSDRVAKIRAAVISGRYPVDLDKLAEKIVDRELLAPPTTDPGDDNNR